MIKLILFVLHISYAASFQTRIERYPKEEIIGGIYTDISKVPFQASVELYRKLLCTASILSNIWLISTARRFLNVTDNSSLQVRTGTSFLERGGKIHLVKRIIPHPSFNNETVNYDISLIELETPIEYNNKRKPIAIAHANENPRIFQKVTVAGFGDLTSNSTDSPLIKILNLKVTCNMKCDRTYTNNRLTSKMFCAESSLGVLSIGDSGSPAVLKGKLYGIVSSLHYGTMLSAFTKVSEYYRWILNHTNIDN